MDEESASFKNDFLDDICDSTYGISNIGGRRHATRQAISHVDFRFDPDSERTPENENLRKKHRVRCQYVPSCHCQQANENHSLGVSSRKYETFGRKNSAKPEATLSQHLDYGNSKNANFPIRNNRRAGSQQRSQTRRPGTSASHCQNRNNPRKPGIHCLSQKYENLSRCECPRGDSPHREIVNSDAATEAIDCRLPCSRNIISRDDLCWQSPLCELHSEPEMDSPIKNHRHDCLEPKKRFSGQRENADASRLEDDGKPLIETGSSVEKDDWQQYERDQRELKNLGEDLRDFVKRKLSTGQIHEEKKEEKEDTLEKINLFVSKLPIPRQKNSTSRRLSESREKPDRSPEERTRIRASKIDPRRTRRSSRIDERLRDERKDQELARKLKEESADIQLESSKLDEEEEEEEEEEEKDTEAENDGREDETGSETEEEAKQLLREETDSGNIMKKLKEPWSEWKARDSRDSRQFEREKRDEKTRDGSEGENHSRKRRTGCRESSKNSCSQMDVPFNAGKQNYRDNAKTRGPEFKNESETREKVNCRKSRTNARVRNAESDDKRETMYERANSVLDGSRKNSNVPTAACGDGKIELETGKTRTRIDEMIDDGLNREANRQNCGTPLDTKKNFTSHQDFPCENEETKRVFPRRASSKSRVSREIICDECFCHTLAKRREIPTLGPTTNGELVKIKRDDCFCQRITKILAENSSPRDYVRKLKNRRWDYLHNIQSVLAKLYDLERFLDSCSPERNKSILKSEIDADASTKGKKNLEKGHGDRFYVES